MGLGRNLLFYGDNLDMLRNRIPSASVDLIYLDPPFNSNRSYNVLFRHRSGAEAQAQIEAFDDTWIWSQESERVYQEQGRSIPSTRLPRLTTMAGQLMIPTADTQLYAVDTPGGISAAALPQRRLRHPAELGPRYPAPRREVPYGPI